MTRPLNPVHDGDAPRVARRWPTSTIVCVATGPSLTPPDVEYCRGKAPVIVVNDAYRIAPWADALYATDCSWWLRHQGVPGFAGEKWSIEHSTWRNCRDRWPDVKRLRNTGSDGLELDPSGIRHGRNSGFAAVNLAVHYGARRIVLLGYDMGHRPDQPSHFFGAHFGALRQHSPYHLFLHHFQTLTAPLKAAGVEVLNCTRETQLRCFPRVALEAAL